MSNNLRTRDGLPYNFVNGLKVRGMDIESLIPGIEGIPEAGSKYQFAGNGTNKIFTLPVSPYNKDAIDVHVKQLYVHPNDYTLVGDTLTLTEAPPALEVGETYNVVVKVNLTILNGYVNANRVSFEDENLDSILEKAKSIANYPTLRAYAGSAVQVRITDPGIEGFFYWDPADTASADNGGTVIVAGTKRWKRHYSGAVNVRWFGAKGDGVTDDTAAIQGAINWVGPLGGGIVLVPTGHYKITTVILVPHQNVQIVGENRFGTLFVQHNSASHCLELNGNFCGMERVSFIYATTPARNSTAIKVTKSYVRLSDFAVRSAGIGLHFIGGNAVFGTAIDFMILDYETCGIILESLNDVLLSKFLLNAGNEQRGTLGGIRLVNKVEALMCTDADILLGRYSLTVDATENALGVRPAYNNFTNIFFDSAERSSVVSKCVETDFIGCWFSGARFLGGEPGLFLTDCRSIRFTNTRFFNNGGHGVVVHHTASDITFDNCKAESNSVTSGPGTAHGFLFTDNCSDFKVIGCTAGNGVYTGVQGFGIFVGNGCDNFVLRDNNVRTNQSGGILDGSASNANKTIHGNIGYRTSNTGTATILAGTTSIAVDHGLNLAPRQQEIALTRGSGNAGSTDLYVSSITSTQIVINTAAAPTSNMVVNWMIRCAGS